MSVPSPDPSPEPSIDGLALPQGPTRGHDVVLDVRGLVKHYDDAPVLRGIDLTVGDH